MEDPSTNVKSKDFSATKRLKMEQCVTTNWRITEDNKRLCDAISTIYESKAPERLTIDDIVCRSSLVLQPLNANDDDRWRNCTIDVNFVTGHKISRIGIVSEGSVLEFFKESEEYAGTVFAEFIEAFDEATVYVAEFAFPKPTAQAAIRFTRIDNSRPDMYLYGIKIVLADAQSLPNDRSTFENIFRTSLGSFLNDKPSPMIPTDFVPDTTNIPDYEANLETIRACLENFVGKALKPPNERNSERKTATTANADENEKFTEKTEVTDEISNVERRMDEKMRDLEKRLFQKIDDAEKKISDEKMRDLEKRLFQKIDDAEKKINDKLDLILKRLELRDSSS